MGRGGLFFGFAALCAALSACGETEPELTPLEAVELKLDQGDGYGAEKRLQAMLEAGASLPELASYLGEAAMVQGDLAKARRYLGAGEFSRETSGYGFKQLGRLELRAGNLSAAGAAFDRALQFTADDPELWVDIGRLRYRGGEHLQALEAADRALQYGPDSPEAMLFRGQLARDALGPGTALAVFSQALENHPDHLELLTALAATLGEVGRVNEALDTIRRIDTISPAAPRIHYLQAVIAARAGNTGLARSLLLRASAEEQAQPAAQLLSGVLDMEAGNFASAAQTLLRLHDRQPDNLTVRRLLARALSQSGAERELIARLGAEAELPSASPYLKTTVARAYEVLDQREKAAVLLDAAAQPTGMRLAPLPSSMPRALLETIHESEALVTRDRVRDALRPGMTEQALASATAYAARFPGSGDALSLLGDAQLVEGDPEAALATYRQVARIRQGWPLTKRLMAAQIAAGERDGANAVLRDYLIAGARNPEASQLYARVLGGAGEWRRARSLLKSALDHGGRRDPGTLALLSEAERRLGEPEAALEHAWAAYRLQPMNPVVVAALMRATEDPELRARMRWKLNALT